MFFGRYGSLGLGEGVVELSAPKKAGVVDVWGVWGGEWGVRGAG